MKIILDTIEEVDLDAYCYCKANNYQDNIPDPDSLDISGETISNPESKLDFAKRMIVKHILHNVQSYEVNKDITTARDTAMAAVVTRLKIT